MRNKLSINKKSITSFFPLGLFSFYARNFLKIRNRLQICDDSFIPYNYRTSKNLDRILDKLFKKDKSTYEQVLNKIEEIINSPDVEHYKNLRYDLKDKKRVNIGHFVLVFKFNKTENLIYFDDFDYHYNVYKRGY